MISNNPLRMLQSPSFYTSSCLILYRNFVNLFTSFVLQFVDNCPQMSKLRDSSPLSRLKKIFETRIIPFSLQKLEIKPWIEKQEQIEKKILSTLLKYNQENPGFLLLLKHVYNSLSNELSKKVNIKNCWQFLKCLLNVENDLKLISLFFKVVERYHDPVDTASNYLKRSKDLKHPLFMEKAKQILCLNISIQEFILVIFLFMRIYKKEHSNRQNANKNVNYVMIYKFETLLKVFFLIYTYRILSSVK